MHQGQQAWDVLVTNAGARLGYNIVRNLGRHGLRVGVGTDSSSGMARYSRYCAGSFRHPSHAEAPLGFIAAVREAVLVHHPAVLIPGGEDIFVLADHWPLLKDLPVRTVMASPEILRSLDNKHEATETAKSLGISTPTTIYPEKVSDVVAFARQIPGPLILKMVRSSGARGVYCLEAGQVEKDLARALEQSGKGFGEFIVQEFLHATGYGVSMLFDHGELKASFTHRRLRELSPGGGASTLRESVREPGLEAQAERLLRHVGYHGVAMVEFKRDETSGKSWFLEVNPRWWGSLALAIRAGVEFPLLFCQVARGDRLAAPPEYRIGVRVRWLLGDLLALTRQVAGQRRLSAYRHLFCKVDGYDDVYADDLLPLAAELTLRLGRPRTARSR
jgi:predicted ATP-grasp superfamily ATP-dependent carboligase